MLQDREGRYLTGHQKSWAFTEDVGNARVFDFIGDRIGEQLRSLWENHGLLLRAAPVDPGERYELCDQCGRRMMAFRVFFDGASYLCPECRQATAPTSAAKA